MSAPPDIPNAELIKRLKKCVILLQDEVNSLKQLASLFVISVAVDEVDSKVKQYITELVIDLEAQQAEKDSPDDYTPEHRNHSGW